MLSVTVVAIMLCASSQAQVTFREIRRKNPITKERYVFPVVMIPQGTEASAKINNLIREDLLDAKPGVPERSIFKEVW
jgi:hypothetical protein